MSKFACCSTCLLHCNKKRTALVTVLGSRGYKVNPVQGVGGDMVPSHRSTTCVHCEPRPFLCPEIVVLIVSLQSYTCGRTGHAHVDAELIEQRLVGLAHALVAAVVPLPHREVIRVVLHLPMVASLGQLDFTLSKTTSSWHSREHAEGALVVQHSSVHCAGSMVAKAQQCEVTLVGCVEEAHHENPWRGGAVEVGGHVGNEPVVLCAARVVVHISRQVHCSHPQQMSTSEQPPVLPAAAVVGLEVVGWEEQARVEAASEVHQLDGTGEGGVTACAVLRALGMTHTMLPRHV